MPFNNLLPSTSNRQRTQPTNEEMRNIPFTSRLPFVASPERLHGNGGQRQMHDETDYSSVTIDSGSNASSQSSSSIMPPKMPRSTIIAARDSLSSYFEPGLENRHQPPDSLPTTVHEAQNGNSSPLYENLESLDWKLLPQALCNVTLETSDFFAFYVDSEGTMYRGYILGEVGKPTLSIERRILGSGEPAIEWLANQPCNNSLSDVVRVTSLKWLFEISSGRIPEAQIILLIAELQSFDTISRTMLFMNKVNIMLQQPIFAQDESGRLMTVGNDPPETIAEQQIAAFSGSNHAPPLSREYDAWVPRDLGLTLVDYGLNRSSPLVNTGALLFRLHMRYVTHSGRPGRRITENVEIPVSQRVEAAFKHLLPASPAIVSRDGRTILVCELIDTLTARYLGTGIARVDSILLPESLNRSFSLSFKLYYREPGHRQKTNSSLFKSLIASGTMGLIRSPVIANVRFEISVKPQIRPVAYTGKSLVNDYLNSSEAVFLEIGELTITGKSTLLTKSKNDPLLVRVGDAEAIAFPGEDVAMLVKLQLPISSVKFELLNGSTIVGENVISGDAFHLDRNWTIPLCEVNGEDGQRIALLNFEAVYAGREKFPRTSVIASILNSEVDFDLDDIYGLQASDLKKWVSELITELLYQVLNHSETIHVPKCQQARATKAFKALVILISLSESLEVHYLFESYLPPRKLLAAPLSETLLVQYCSLVDERCKELICAFQSGTFLARLLNFFGVTPRVFVPLTQSTMAFFSTDTPVELMVECLRHLDELYLDQMDLQIASQIGSIFASASRISNPEVRSEFFWTLGRVSKAEAFASVLGPQLSSLVLTFINRLQDATEENPLQLEQVRALAALVKAVYKDHVVAVAFLTLTLGLTIASEPRFQSVPVGPLFRAHRIGANSDSEQVAAFLELSLTLHDLTDDALIPTRSFLGRLDNATELVHQLCVCANMMAEPILPSEWVSLNAVFLLCALRCSSLAATILRRLAAPDDSTRPETFPKMIWSLAFETLLKLTKDPRINNGLWNRGIEASPLRQYGIDRRLVEFGFQAISDLWSSLNNSPSAIDCGSEFLQDRQFWSQLLLIGFNADTSDLTARVAEMIASMIVKMCDTSKGEKQIVRPIICGLDHLFRTAGDQSTNGIPSIQPLPRFVHAPELIASIMEHVESRIPEYYSAELPVLRTVELYMRTCLSSANAKGTGLALWALMSFIASYDLHYLLDSYMEDFISIMGGKKETLRDLYTAFSHAYSALSSRTTVGESAICVPSQRADVRERALVVMGLKPCENQRGATIADSALEDHFSWFASTKDLLIRSELFSKWFPASAIAPFLTGHNEAPRNWYLLRFKGSGFGAINGREYIWERRRDTRLPEAIATISGMFNGANCLPWNSAYHGGGSFIAILAVERIESGFVSAKPVFDGRTELTALKVLENFPTVTGFAEVVDRTVNVLTPAETATRDVNMKTGELRRALESADLKQIDLVLSGILNAGVNGGMNRYTDLLKEHGPVSIAFKGLRTAVGEALDIYGRRCGPELQEHYLLLRDRAARWVNIDRLPAS